MQKCLWVLWAKQYANLQDLDSCMFNKFGATERNSSIFWMEQVAMEKSDAEKTLPQSASQQNKAYHAVNDCSILKQAANKAEHGV